MKETIRITKTGNNKYEFITKDINIESGLYYIYGLEKNLFVIKRQFFGENQHNSSLAKKKQENEAEKSNEKQKVEPKPEQKEDYNELKDESTKEWYKKALELKKELNQNEFMILQDLEEVRKISFVNRQEINSGEVLGIRGFDKNYYIFKKTHFEKIKDVLLSSMNSEPVTIDYLLNKTRTQKEELTGIIELLKEQSDIIEVKKGLFKRV